MSLKFNILSAAILAALHLAQPAGSADLTANSSAIVIQPISVISLVSLDFGTFASTDSAGTVVLPPTGSRSATGGVELAATNNGTKGRLVIRGEPFAVYSVPIPVSTTISLGEITLTLHDFTCALSGCVSTGGDNADSIVISENGENSMRYGAILDVPANTPAGVYSGTINFTAFYD